MESQVYLKKRPRKLKVAIIGFPGVGMIGLASVRMMVRQLKAEKIGEIISPYYPHQAVMLKSGLLRPTRVTLYRYKDILFVVGDYQPNESVGQYELSYKIVETLKKLKIEYIITVGGYVVRDSAEANKAYIVANNKQMLQKWKEEWKGKGEVGKARGIIVGLAGLIPVVAKYYKIPAMVLLMTTPGGVYDLLALQEAITILRDVFGLPVNLQDIEKKINETKEVMERIKLEVEDKEKESTSPYIR
ncbi:MAG: hypothetical protein GXN92_02565 [Candidatus Micrarchaeota archaeon]|nr:hypothetical protein [Candidatus Micrarchaeota archaeon]